jgi:hypothetical protein
MITFIFTQIIIDLNSREDKFQELVNDGISISNSFMSKSYCPTNHCSRDWEHEDGRLGFVDNGKLVKNDFDDFLELDYEKTRIFLGTMNDYVFYFEFDGNKLSYNGKTVYGKYNNIEDIKSENLVKINRILYYNLDSEGKIVNLVILVF